MKMLKTLKKLKFWHRKKKKKKPYLPPPPPPPPPPPLPSPHCCCSCPSAPPLPPWYDTEQAYDAAAAAAPVPGFVYSTPQQEIVSEARPSYPTLPVTSTSSYQQYMVPNPVYGIPAVPAPTKEKSAGLFGCAVEIGRYLFRCFCPCFQVREAC
ncbi:hypothetical protein PVL29_016271 [Vitis rotundifolia]|uniref:Uncharacterized protein n=1 Tax=Vitis rotundifolia TaxID=103349 RepID=A0AA38ZG66_VITRO|nr:hypothetical protein PVL29_016271 [Vitis rotundifolia]